MLTRISNVSEKQEQDMKLGFIGLGRMGGNMARHLGAAGHDVAVFDVYAPAMQALVERPGISIADSVAEVASGAEAVFTSLPGPPEVESVVLGPSGLLESMQSGSVYLDLSSNAPSLVRRLHGTLAEKGIAMLDAPVSGGEEGAIVGTLSVMVGGDDATFERMKDVLSAFAGEGKVFHCGSIGAGSVTKLCNNICSFANGVILSEALTLGVKAGVDLSVLASVISVSSGSSDRLIRKYPRYLFKGNFTPGFMVSLSAKDARLTLELAEEIGVPMQVASMVRAQIEEAIARGWASDDSDSVAKLQEERAGVQLRLPV
jgi:3-hydroxyisobutyrate dehydrogenase-like beta-hydroxyacid dehydrogenase